MMFSASARKKLARQSNQRFQSHTRHSVAPSTSTAVSIPHGFTRHQVQVAAHRSHPVSLPLAAPSSPSSMMFSNYSTSFDVYCPGAVPETAAEAPPASLIVKVKKRRQNKNKNSTLPQLTWMNGFRDQYLDTKLILKGRGRLAGRCSFCKNTVPTFRCEDCSAYRLLCRECCLKNHQLEPLHWLQNWNGTFFTRTSLTGMGISIQLGHHPSNSCFYAKPATSEFTVLHTNGIHTVSLKFCGCEGAPEPFKQLLEVGWWPATPLDPQTAATFQVLSHFHAVNHNGNCPATDYYRALEELTDGSGLSKPPDRLSQWMVMTREWRHTRMLQRAGRGHDPTGVMGTKPGELSVACRACPQPGINLPSGWEDAPPEVRWLYQLMVSQDANFKQKGRRRANDDADKPFGDGWATFVASDDYLKFVSNHVHEDEISHCVAFAAMYAANTKRAKGLRATGIVSVTCSRHEMFRPCGTGDLQKGERYANIDYVFLSQLMGVMLLYLVVTYDIACQWMINFWNRLGHMPAVVKLPRAIKDIQFRVPKFHLPAHRVKCHSQFSLNFTKWVGRTDGEGIERIWAVFNKIASSVSMMSRGGRQDTLDDFCNHFNWKKTTQLGSSLLKKLTLAIPQAVIHHRAFVAFTTSLKADHADIVQKWEAEVTEWENDRTKPCPYDLPDDNEKLADVKRKMAEEEHERVKAGNAPPIDLSPSSFIIEGLAIEDTQRSLILDIKKETTAIQATKLQTRRTALLRRILNYTKAQSTYMPGLDDHLLRYPDRFDSLTTTPELMPLHLPSSLPVDKRTVICLRDILGIEERLRFAQANDALSALRQQLRTREVAYRHKSRAVHSQRNFSRSKELETAIEHRILVARQQYTGARSALFSLQGPGEWTSTLRELRLEDIRGLSERILTAEEKEEYKKTRVMAGLAADSKDGDDLENIPTVRVDKSLVVGEGRRTLSWIWYSVSDAELEQGGVHETLRVEWLKARARARGWRDELELLEEEMRRSLESCRYMEKWWALRTASRSASCPHLAEGLKAYASQQALLEQKRASQWASKWQSVRERGIAVLSDLKKESEQLDESSFPELVVELDEDPLETLDED